MCAVRLNPGYCLAYPTSPRDRMPTPIGSFISREVYGSRLKSVHPVQHHSCLRFVDVSRGREEKAGQSWKVGLSSLVFSFFNVLTCFRITTKWRRLVISCVTITRAKTYALSRRTTLRGRPSLNICDLKVYGGIAFTMSTAFKVLRDHICDLDSDVDLIHDRERSRLRDRLCRPHHERRLPEVARANERHADTLQEGHDHRHESGLPRTRWSVHLARQPCGCLVVRLTSMDDMERGHEQGGRPARGPALVRSQPRTCRYYQ
jgi:hypothetical protein